MSPTTPNKQKRNNPPSHPIQSHGPRERQRQITFIHPDLGIGGAERLVLDAALALQDRGHAVTIYTSHCDARHCFDEARDGTLDVRVRRVSDWLLPPHVAGRFVVVCAVLRQVVLMWWVVREGRKRKRKGGSDDVEREEVFVVDQVAACVPILRTLGGGGAAASSRILFYCHFPDQLLARRHEGGSVLRLLKAAYRLPFDVAEGWAVGLSDRVVANSRFTREVVGRVFGWERLRRGGGGDVRVVYPCVDTEAVLEEHEGGEGELWGGLKILLSINRFEKKKNMELAVRAYHGLREEERRGTRLVIAGGYDHRIHENAQCHKDLDALATSLGLQTATSKTVVSALSIPQSADVLFLLSVPSAFKRTLLSAASLLLYTPSHEHFGIVPVEAMHAGLPVLAVNTGGPLETVVEGETGWLRDADAVADWTAVMRKVLHGMDASELAEMGRRGKARVESEFSRRTLGQRLEEEIDEMFSTDRKQLVEPWIPFACLAVVGLVAAMLVALVLRRVSV